MNKVKLHICPQNHNEGFKHTEWTFQIDRFIAKYALNYYLAMNWPVFGPPQTVFVKQKCQTPSLVLLWFKRDNIMATGIKIFLSDIKCWEKISMLQVQARYYQKAQRAGYDFNTVFKFYRKTAHCRKKMINSPITGCDNSFFPPLLRSYVVEGGRNYCRTL